MYDEYVKKLSIASESGTIEKDNQQVGYFFREILVWEFNGKLVENYSCWSIHPEGRCSYYYDSESERYILIEKGTFDPQHYETFVEQMKNLQTDWKEEFVYEEQEVQWD